MNAFLRITLLVAIVGSPAKAISSNDDIPTNHPVSKVIKLIKDMINQLQTEGQQDDDTMEKMDCWCTTNEKEKTLAIANGKSKIENLETSIADHVATSDRLGLELKDLKAEVADNQESLDKATAIRQKEQSEFNADEKDMQQAISALKDAITVLSKHHPSAASAFLQVQASGTHDEDVAASLKHTMSANRNVIEGLLTKSQRNLVQEFIETPHQKYAPQSGQIFGILRSMLDTFEANLDNTHKEELAAGNTYAGLKASKEGEIKADQAQVDSKTSLRAETEEKKANAEQELEDTKETLAANQKFLKMLQERCANMNAEFEKRKAARSAEITACSKALTFLTSDEAHALFTKTFNPSFLQLSKAKQSSEREQAVKILKSEGSPKLAALALNARLDSFTKIIEDIDKMVADLNTEKADEIKHKDFCNKNFNSNKLNTEKREREHEASLNHIDALTTEIEQYNQTLEELAHTIATTKVATKRAGENREIENKEFQQTVLEQRQTQDFLNKALAVMKAQYAPENFMQAGSTKDDPEGFNPPGGFKEYKKNAQSGGVIGMMTEIINDAKKMEEEALRDENDAQKTYEQIVRDSNDLIWTSEKNIADTTEARATADGKKVSENENRESLMLELEVLANENAELHGSCDFVLKNFDLRQQARDDEINALQQVKAILKGAK